MKLHTTLLTTVIAVSLFSAAAFAADAGEEIFKAKCAACHPGGGNIMNKKATIKGMKDSKKIIAQVRKGGGGMPAFDGKAISDADAKVLADYIIKTFK